ncbi:hypothetical protein AV530_011951 [Patagioenas fasciata monilis]|uniref:Uncharacterized protein n=1 Tax=Patagioenas fasciata monilis TaxID=372326 RepID=A0A1V4JUR4_PATFA|nr:hypothetical protein AV530_011951 [Patagioenas fasciata monilis]
MKGFALAFFCKSVGELLQVCDLAKPDSIVLNCPGTSIQHFPKTLARGQGFVVLTVKRKMTGTDSGEVAAAERNQSEWPALPLQVKQTTHSSFAERSLNR